MAESKTRAAVPAGFDRIHRILGTAMRAADPATWPSRPHRNGALPVLSSRSQLELALALCDITREASPSVPGFARTVALAQTVVAGEHPARADLERACAPARSDAPELKIAKLAVRAAKNFLFSPPSARNSVGGNVESAAAALIALVPDVAAFLCRLDQLIVKTELAVRLAERDLAPSIDLVVSRAAGAILARLADGSFGVFVKLRARWEWHVGDLGTACAYIPDASLAQVGDDLADLGLR